MLVGFIFLLWSACIDRVLQKLFPALCQKQAILLWFNSVLSENQATHFQGRWVFLRRVNRRTVRYFIKDSSSIGLHSPQDFRIVERTASLLKQKTFTQTLQQYLKVSGILLRFYTTYLLHLLAMYNFLMLRSFKGETIFHETKICLLLFSNSLTGNSWITVSLKEHFLSLEIMDIQLKFVCSYFISWQWQTFMFEVEKFCKHWT